MLCASALTAQLTAFHEARLAAATNKEWRAKQAAKFEREFDVKERIFREKLYQLDVQHIDEVLVGRSASLVLTR